MTEILFTEGDNRRVLQRMIDDGVQVHGIVTDPPYGLVSIQKRFGKKGSAPARTDKNDGSFARVSGGFMGEEWDGTGIERDPEFWRLCLQVLRPGGYCFAFSGSRTGHWQACAMETAGFIMHPMHGWVYGTGFPKAHKADTALRKAGHGAEADDWNGWAFGTQAQKPALEPIFLGQRPYSEKTCAANLLRHGVGAVNVGDCRVPTTENLNGGAYAKEPSARDQMWGAEAGNSWKRGGAGEFVQPEGRYPANLIHDGSDEVKAALPEGADRFFHAFPVDARSIYYSPKANAADRAGSKHPTVKPVMLLRYLIRHIIPEGGTVLDPFAGTGTTGEAARREGRDAVLIEGHPKYAADIRRRFGLADEFDGSDLI